MSKIDVEVGVKLHNRFDIEVRDAATGKLKQQARAYNIVLNQMYNRLCTTSAGWFHSIAFGTGTGTLDPTRVSLFSHLGYKVASLVESIKAIPQSSLKASIVLNPEEFVDDTITEVGILWGTSGTPSNNLVTHALLQDIEGNTISITKTATDVITIYATVFSTFSIPSDCYWLNVENNALINQLTNLNASPMTSLAINLGLFDGPGSIVASSILGYSSLGSVNLAAPTVDIENRRRIYGSARFNVDVGNGNIVEIAFNNLFRITLPTFDSFTGQAYTNVPIAVGDGIKTAFILPSRNVKADSIVMKINGTSVMNFTSKRIVTYVTPIKFAPTLHNATTRGWASKDFSKIVFYEPSGNTLYTYQNIDGVYVLVSTFTRGTKPSASGLSGDGLVLVIVVDNVAYTYDWIGTNWVVREATLASTNTLNVCLTYDGNRLAIFTTVLSVYEWDDEEAEWVLVYATDTLSVANPSSWQFEWKENDTVLISIRSYTPISTPAHFYIYEWKDNELVPYIFPSVGVGSASTTYTDISSDKKTCIVSSNSVAPYVWIFDWDDVEEEWVLRSAAGLDFTAGGYIYIASNNVFYYLQDVYNQYHLYQCTWNGSSWTKVTIKESFNVLTIDRPAFYVRPDLNRILQAGRYSTYTVDTKPEMFDMKARTTEVTFSTPVDEDDVITADYIVEGIHKTNQYVLDIGGMTVQYGEGGP